MWHPMGPTSRRWPSCASPSLSRYASRIATTNGRARPRSAIPALLRHLAPLPTLIYARRVARPFLARPPLRAHPLLYTRLDVGRYACFLMDYCSGGDLHAVLRRHPGGRLPVTVARFYAVKVLLVLEYLHAFGFVYRDLKPENPTGATNSKDYVGTHEYLVPELMSGTGHGNDIDCLRFLGAMTKKSKIKRSSTARNPAAELTDDLVVEILSLLPAKSVCRCKCVSRRWRGLIADAGHRKKLPQTLAGFFYRSESGTRFPMEARHFVDLAGRGRPLVHPSFSFLPRRFERVRMEWVALPESGYGAGEDEEDLCTRLGFDHAVSSHFHVFELVLDECGCVVGVEIYSSETGEWNYQESGWLPDTMVSGDQKSVLFNGILHLVVLHRLIVAVDVKGGSWLNMDSPETVDVEDIFDWDPCFIGQSQGKLCYVSEYDAVPLSLSVWVLEDCTTNEWILKHNVSTVQLTEKMSYRYHSCYYHVVTVHPDCNLIYYVAGRNDALMAYDMDSKESHFVQNLASDFKMGYLPYVPLYSEMLANSR
uniref:Protein kinase domain-containing protein n=1 Tax=Oryza brachyantha TaxID=4533 RepID=J3M4E4_ORYBR